MTDFEEYIRQGEPQKREKGLAWQTAIGLQAADGLTTSDYLMQTARAHLGYKYLYGPHVTHIMATLKEKGLIKRVGSNKSGHPNAGRRSG